MKILKRIAPLLIAVAIWALTSVAWSQTPLQQSVPLPLIFAGAGGNLGITRLLAAAFMQEYPEIKIEIPGSISTNGAIAAMTDGAIALGLLARPLDDKEKLPKFVVQPYARVPLVVGVNPGVSDDEITFEELVDIYKGTKTRWKDGKEIVVLNREPSESSMLVIAKKIPGFKEAQSESFQARRWIMYFTDQDINQAISKTFGAIGVSDLGMIATEQLGIKVLKLNGIVPGPDSLASGQYPLSRELFFLYRNDSLPKGVKAFMDFVLSEEGTKILRSNGYLPLN